MVTIIIVNENTKDVLELCLLSIKKHTNYPYKVIVVDNSSSDGSLDLLKNFNWVKTIIIPGGKIGERHGWALDIGVQHVKTKYFLTIDSDVEILDYHWLSKMVADIENDKGVFLGEIASPIKKSSFGGKFRERCLPHCLLVNTKFFKKNKCTFIPVVIPPGSDKHQEYQDDVGTDILFKTKKKEQTYCLMDQSITDKFIHYGGLTALTLSQTKEWKDKLESYTKKDFKLGHKEKEEIKKYLKQSKWIKNEKIDLIKTRINLLKNSSIPHKSDKSYKRCKHIDNTLKCLSLKLFNLGKNYLTSENYELSIQKLKAASYYADANFKYRVIAKMALAYTRNKIPKEGIRLLDDLLKSDPNNINLLYTMGSVYKVNNELCRAIKYYQKVIELKTKHKDKFRGGAYFHLGEIFLKTGETSLAVNSFKLCLKFNPYHNMAIAHLKTFRNSEKYHL